MHKRVEKTWAIYRPSAKGIYLGQVDAADEDKAIKIAIEEFGVTNPHHQKRIGGPEGLNRRDMLSAIPTNQHWTRG